MIDTGKVKIGLRHQRRQPYSYAGFGPYRNTGRMVRMKIALSNIHLVLKNYWALLRSVRTDYLVLWFLYLFFLILGITCLIAITSSKDIYRDTQPMAKIMQDAASFVNGEEANPCVDDRAKIKESGDTQCVGSDGRPSFFVHAKE